MASNRLYTHASCVVTLVISAFRNCDLIMTMSCFNSSTGKEFVT